MKDVPKFSIIKKNITVNSGSVKKQLGSGSGFNEYGSETLNKSVKNLCKKTFKKMTMFTLMVSK